MVFCFFNGVLDDNSDGRSVYKGEPAGLKSQMGQLFDDILRQMQFGVMVFLVLVAMVPFSRLKVVGITLYSYTSGLLALAASLL